MLRPHYLLFLILAALTAGVFWSCDRMSGDILENQPPVVQFVNVPFDSSQFSYAPTVYWFGYDPDGFVTAYQYLDDQSQAAIDSYHTSDAALAAYIASQPATAWTTTENTQETIYLLTTEGDTTEHVFIVRSVDNHGAYSSPRVRTFFRTNQAPNTPEIKKTPLDNWDTEVEYSDSFVVADTLLIGDAPSLTWSGIQFVWRGTDPDSRELNIIPLEFSYLLTNLTTQQEMPFPRIIDSLHVEWVYDWSDWSDDAQVILSEALTHGEMETGNYKLELRVRDDGLTLSDTNATAWFYAIRPTFAKQLLIVDENKPVSGPVEPIRGGYSDSLILAYYYDMIPDAFELAEQIRPYVDDDRDGVPDISEPFVYDTSAEGSVSWYRNKTLATSIPFSLIHQFKWVWIIDDDNPQLSGNGLTNIETRQRAMGRYMNVGGQVMISGRRIFNGSYNLAGDVNIAGSTYGRFFGTYFNLQTVNAKPAFNSSNDVADFGGANTANPMLPDIRIDSAKVCSLRYGSSYYCCLPEIDYFGRSTSSSGYNYSETVYNYSSCTANQPYEMTNVDGQVLSSTPTQAILSPDTANTPQGRRHTRILGVSRAFNVTRGVYGEVMAVRVVGTQWQIVVSTPTESGAWVDQDVLELDYTYIPISINHDKPVGARFIRIEGVVEIDYQTGDFVFVGETRFRSAIFTFPLSFLDPTPAFVPGYGEISPGQAIVATQLLFFNSIRRFEVGRGDE